MFGTHERISVYLFEVEPCHGRFAEVTRWSGRKTSTKRLCHIHDHTHIQTLVSPIHADSLGDSPTRFQMYQC